MTTWTIIDLDTQQPLPGAHLVLTSPDGAQRGGVADADGQVRLAIQGADIGTASFVGYRTATFPITDQAAQTATVYLRPGIDLPEVVITPGDATQQAGGMASIWWLLILYYLSTRNT